MTEQEKAYIDANTNEKAALAYAVVNNQMTVEDTGLTEEELFSDVKYRGKGSDKSEIPLFADRAFNGDAMLNAPETEETEEMEETDKKEKKEKEEQDSKND